VTDDAPAARSGPLAGTLLGRYALVRLLGEGGMGSVYEATHCDLGKRAAIKTLHERYANSPEARQRFLREGRAAAQIRHSNVADVYDVAIDGSYPYLVMELLEGEDLSRLISRQAPLGVEQAADLLVPVVAAVAAAHDLGIVHRDLKPENIFVTTDRSGMVPKVLDFGISKLTDLDGPSVLTGTGAVLGTPHYMSPEQAQGDRELDARSDQYALGVILYQCVTGRRPLQGIALYSLIQRTVHGDFPPPRQVHPALPSTFEELILKAMARQPERRFATTRALGEALLEFASPSVRTAYARELGSAVGAVVPELPRRESSPAELSTTLGESAHERPIAHGRPPVRWLGARLGVLLGALLLLGVIAWRVSVARSGSEAIVARGDGPPASTAPPERVSSAPLRPRDAPAAASSLQELSLEAERHFAERRFARAADGFRRAYALGLEPRSLERAAQAQTALWRETPSAEGCRAARELWLAHSAVVSAPDARSVSRAALATLGNCSEPATSQRPVPAPATPVRARAGAARAPAPSPTPAPEAPHPPPSAATRVLPSEDPEDGFVDIQPARNAVATTPGASAR